MAVHPATDNTQISTRRLHTYLEYLRLPYVREHHATLAKEAAEHSRPHVQYLETLIEGEAHLREDRRTQRRVMLARFPVLKTLDQVNWSWPKKINRLQVQNLFRLKLIEDKANVIFLGGVGLGKSHLTTALGYAACLQGYSVLFTTAIDAINTLAAHGSGRLKSEIKKYLKPRVLILDELGYLPIDKTGADLLFQVISGRYEPESQGCDAFMRYRRNVALLSSPPTVLSRSGPRSSTTTAP